MIKLPLILPKLLYIKKKFKGKEITILDVGSGNGSPTFTKLHISNCKYYGLDIVKDYNYGSGDFKLMEEFYEVDLVKSNLEMIPDNKFDAIIMAHVIEHLPNGEDVIKKLAKKLKIGGVFYIEFPGKRSLNLPSFRGTLNFYDDNTHMRVYSYKEIGDVFIQNNFKVLKSGTRRSFLHISMMPFKIIYQIIKNEKILAPIFWDITGFAEYVFAEKKDDA